MAKKAATKKARHAAPPKPRMVREARPAKMPAKAESAGDEIELAVRELPERAGVVIVGSLNMDLVARTEMMPVPGQTVAGQDLMQNPGGKGANQATAVGRLWSKRGVGGGLGAKMIGRVGEDLFGDAMVEALRLAKVDATSILRTRGVPSGVALIVVDRHGENAIVVSGGANMRLSATDLLAQRKTIESSMVMAVQLETPYDTVACAIALAKRSKVLTILDPAPAPPEGLPESLYHVDILSPNQSEAQLLTGIPVRNVEDARRAGEKILARGTQKVVFKMGSQGAVIVGRDASGMSYCKHVPGFRVRVVDTTAAGDAFTGALAVGLAEEMPLEDAVRFANAAGALTCMKSGAVAAIPTRAEVDKFIAGDGK